MPKDFEDNDDDEFENEDEDGERELVTDLDDIEDDEQIRLMPKDLKAAVIELIAKGPEAHAEVRFLIDQYYDTQKKRVMAGNRAKALEKTGKPNIVITWAQLRERETENYIRRFLAQYSLKETSGLGAWVQQHCGVGPVIASGLLAHIPMLKTPSVSHLWSFAGLNPLAVWRKGEKRPWNARLKQVAYKLSDSFVKQSGNPKCFYGRYYLKVKAELVNQNENGRFKEAAAKYLVARKWKKTTKSYEAYTAGRLPAAQLDRRARRKAVKLFLSHYWDAAYRITYNEEPPLPYAIAVLGHKDMIQCPIPLPPIKPKNQK